VELKKPVLNLQLPAAKVKIVLDLPDAEKAVFAASS
jgi:hypothetical protein